MAVQGRKLESMESVTGAQMQLINKDGAEEML